MVLHILMRTIGLSLVAIVAFFSVFSGISLFTWHPILMSAGVRNQNILNQFHTLLNAHFCSISQFILLMTEAIVAFTSKSFVAKNLRYKERLTLHWVLQLSGATLIGLAFYSIYTHKNNNNYEHFKTSHASLGLTTCLTVGGTITGGIAAKYSLLKSSIKPAVLKIVHSSFGVLAYVLGIYTFCLGVDSVWFRAQASQFWIDILTYGAISVAMLALIKPLISIASKLRHLIKSKV